jgi:hypothetical protein
MRIGVTDLQPALESPSDAVMLSRALLQFHFDYTTLKLECPRFWEFNELVRGESGAPDERADVKMEKKLAPGGCYLFQRRSRTACNASSRVTSGADSRCREGRRSS